MKKSAQSQRNRWSEPRYSKTSIDGKLTLIRKGAQGSKLWGRFRTVGQAAAGAIALVFLVAGLVWIVGGTTELIPGQAILETVTSSDEIGCMAVDSYLVLEGGGIDAIARVFGISADQIRSLNGIAHDVEPGQMIKLVGCPMRYGTPFPGGRYVVQAGDTCQSIAEMNTVNLEYMAAINGLGSDCQLEAGQAILLPFSNQVKALQPVRLYYFSGDRCGQPCISARQYLDELMGRSRGLDVVEYNVEAVATNQIFYERMAARAGMSANVLPALFLSERFWLGFDSTQIGDIEAIVAECLQNGCSDTLILAGGYPGIATIPEPQLGEGKGCGEIGDLLISDGDTVRSVAEKYGVPGELIRLVNGISGDAIAPGSHIRLVGCPITIGTPFPPQSHIVQAGDTCQAIAYQYQVDAESLRVLNHLSTACEMVIGQELVIPWFSARPMHPSETPFFTETPTPQIVQVSLEQAEELVQAWVFRDNPQMNPEAVFPLIEITPEDVWQRMGVQVFKVTEGVKAFESFLIQGDVVLPLGTAFGGMDVDHMLVTDLDGNQSHELLFTYSFGSGIHQSSAGIVVRSQGVPQVYLSDTIHYQGDFNLENVDDQTVRLLGTPNSQEQVETLGRIVFRDGRLDIEP